MSAPNPTHIKPPRTAPWRRGLLLGLVAVGVVGLVARAAWLQLVNNEFLQKQGDARHVRPEVLQAHRGVISDRAGEPLAISTPVDTVGAVPEKLLALPAERLAELAEMLDMDAASLRAYLERNAERKFLFLRRHMVPQEADRILAADFPGVSREREYRRYYPTGEVAAHLVGLTNVEDEGQEGLERAYDEWLQGRPGKKLMIKDLLGRAVRDVKLVSEAEPGKDLALSIDREIQYLAYRELKAAVIEHRAKGGSVVVMDATSGEVLALVNQPSYNPNDRGGLRTELMRNAAVLDTFEPGSTIKPFTVLAGLRSGAYTPATHINTAPGLFRVGRHTISDVHNYGDIDVSTIIQKSSNVGVAKIALAIGAEPVADVLTRAGFGENTGTGFPNESAGTVRPFNDWVRLDVATIAFGYGMTVTPLQLARAYAVLANRGVRTQVSLLKVDGEPNRELVFEPALVRSVVEMMERVTLTGGTATLAQIDHYRVAGKTGTVKKSVGGGYADDSYVAVFAGFTPVEGRSLVGVVVIDEPRGDQYYGGLVAAPVFKRVMAGALRLLNIPPDQPEQPDTRQARTPGGAPVADRVVAPVVDAGRITEPPA